MPKTAKRNYRGNGKKYADIKQYSADEVVEKIHRYFQKEPFEYLLNGNCSPDEEEIGKNCNRILESIAVSFVPDLLESYQGMEESADYIAANAISFAARFMGAKYRPKENIHDHFRIGELTLLNNWQKHMKEIKI